jgi:hypothetical protein
MAIYHEMGQPESVAAVKEFSAGTTIHETHEAKPHCSPVVVISWIVILHQKKARPLSGAPQANTLLSGVVVCAYNRKPFKRQLHTWLT